MTTRILAPLLLASSLTLGACVSTPSQDERLPTMPQAVEQACGTYRAMMTAPMPPSETAKLRIACEEAMRAADMPRPNAF